MYPAIEILEEKYLASKPHLKSFYNLGKCPWPYGKNLVLKIITEYLLFPYKNGRLRGSGKMVDCWHSYSPEQLTTLKKEDQRTPKGTHRVP
jgi:hypothetical protein